MQIYYAFSFPAAVDGRDYLGFTDRLLRFEPAVDELSLTVDLMDDSIVEFTEELQVVVQPGDGETGVQFPRGQQSAIRILDDNDCKYLRNLVYSKRLSISSNCVLLSQCTICLWFCLSIPQNLVPCESSFLPQVCSKNKLFTVLYIVVQLLFLPAEYRVREEQGDLPLSLIQLGESERLVQFSIAYNETTTTAMSMANMKHVLYIMCMSYHCSIII